MDYTILPATFDTEKSAIAARDRLAPQLHAAHVDVAMSPEGKFHLVAMYYR